MAIFRKLHVSFWSDIFVCSLTPEQRYFFLYILTNDKTKQCGIYEISKRQISFDTGYDLEQIDALIKFFSAKGKIKYSESTNELAIKNWLIYNYSTSPKVKSCIDKELKTVKNRVLIQYINSMRTLSQEEQEEEQEEEENKNRPTIEQVKAYFKEKGYSEQSAIRAFEYYESNNWKDSQNKQVKNWKQKMIAVWFKEENKAPITPTKRPLDQRDYYSYSEYLQACEMKGITPEPQIVPNK